MGGVRVAAGGFAAQSPTLKQCVFAVCVCGVCCIYIVT